MSNNHINLFKMIEDEMLTRLGFSINNLDISYEHLGQTRTIDLSKLEDDLILLNDFDPDWDPTNHNLRIKMELSFENITLLFGANSVTASENKIGLAAKAYSKDSNQQQIYPISLLNSEETTKKISYEFEFPPAFLRGSINIELFFYLAEMNKQMLGQAKKVGTILNENLTYLLTIYVDGDGSLFPITEFHDPNGPFWQLEKNWVSSEEDTFDSSNVRLAINVEHQLFNQINDGKQRASQKVMNDIITQAMSMIIQEVLIVEQAQLSEADESVENSILRVVKYWVASFEVDTTSIFSITNTLNQNIERSIRGDK